MANNIKPQAFLVPKDADPLVKRLASAVTSQSRGVNGTFLTDDGGRQWRLAARQYGSGGATKSAIEIQVSSGEKSWKTIVGITEDGTVYGLGSFSGSANFSSLGLEHQ